MQTEDKRIPPSSVSTVEKDAQVDLKETLPVISVVSWNVKGIRARIQTEQSSGWIVL